MHQKIISILSYLSILSTLLIPSTSVYAHFGVIIPSDNIVSTNEPSNITLALSFTHPFEGQLMDMAPPEQFGVFVGGKPFDLTASLKEKKAALEQNATARTWNTEYQIKRPGDYTFFVKPQPYWEPVEDSFIIHYTKVCIHAFGLEKGWDQPVGLKTEIVPLTRPYGLWTNNLFTGQVLVDGKPAPFAEIEVEYLNSSPENPAPVTAPDDPFITQVVKADSQGVFSYALVRQGWWGFAALTTADYTLPHDGQEKNVELGAVYWVRAQDMK